MSFILCNKARKNETDKGRSFNPQSLCQGQVGFQDNAVLIDAEIAHGSEIVEVDILFVGFHEFDLSLPERFILHLQFDLMHHQLMIEPLCLLKGKITGDGKVADLFLSPSF